MARWRDTLASGRMSRDEATLQPTMYLSMWYYSCQGHIESNASRLLILLEMQGNMKIQKEFRGQPERGVFVFANFSIIFEHNSFSGLYKGPLEDVNLTYVIDQFQTPLSSSLSASRLFAFTIPNHD
ncbi:hypothetical protein M5689_024975 [Euphorbia peplus]|nr:hypothetical protein M5689_024975 [Euphorbia peplus]